MARAMVNKAFRFLNLGPKRPRCYPCQAMSFRGFVAIAGRVARAVSLAALRAAGALLYSYASVPGGNGAILELIPSGDNLFS